LEFLLLLREGLAELGNLGQAGLFLGRNGFELALEGLHFDSGFGHVLFGLNLADLSLERAGLESRRFRGGGLALSTSRVEILNSVLEISDDGADTLAVFLHLLFQRFQLVHVTLQALCNNVSLNLSGAGLLFADRAFRASGLTGLGLGLLSERNGRTSSALAFRDERAELAFGFADAVRERGGGVL